jgi:uncharacterized membrane protein
MADRADQAGPTHPIQFNVEAIAKLEAEALERRTRLERLSEAFAKFIGTMTFLLVHVVIFTLWIVVNRGMVPGVKIFDPFPFGILTAMVSAEGVFLTIFVLISQNRMTRQADRRAHLDLQVGMLAEQELTTVLQLLEKVCRHIGVDVGPAEEKVQEFSGATDVHKLANQLDERLPE